MVAAGILVFIGRRIGLSLSLITAGNLWALQR